jgi:hypothetical protein
LIRFDFLRHIFLLGVLKTTNTGAH